MKRVDEKKSGRLVGAAETSKELAECHRLRRKNLNILGLPKRKDWPQCHRESSWQVPQSRLCQKKEHNLQSRASDREEAESLGEREQHLGEREGYQNGCMGGMGGLHGKRRQVPRR